MLPLVRLQRTDPDVPKLDVRVLSCLELNRAGFEDEPFSCVHVRLAVVGPVDHLRRPFTHVPMCGPTAMMVMENGSPSRLISRRAFWRSSIPPVAYFAG